MEDAQVEAEAAALATAEVKAAAAAALAMDARNQLPMEPPDPIAQLAAAAIAAPRPTASAYMSPPATPPSNKMFASPSRGGRGGRGGRGVARGSG